MSMSLPEKTLARFVNRVFVETGTFDGRGVLLAQKVGFKEFHTIELDPGRAKRCREVLGKVEGAHFYEGDSVDLLPKILSTLDEKATIFLDAHPVGEADRCKIGKYRHPLVHELNEILRCSKRKDHTIIVDDRHDFRIYGTTDDEIKAKLSAVNPGYKVFVEGDVIVAEIPAASAAHPTFEKWYAMRGQGSGPGSSPEYTKLWRPFLEDFIGKNRISSVLDFGCGDWQSSRLIDWKTTAYHGVDVVPALVDRLRAAYARPGVTFSVVDPENPQLPGADLLIVKDVLQHLPNASVLKLLEKFRAFPWALLVNDWSGGADVNKDIQMAGYRKLDFSKPPFNLSVSLVFDFGTAWRKRAYLWKPTKQ